MIPARAWNNIFPKDRSRDEEYFFRFSSSDEIMKSAPGSSSSNVVMGGLTLGPDLFKEATSNPSETFLKDFEDENEENNEELIHNEKIEELFHKEDNKEKVVVSDNNQTNDSFPPILSDNPEPEPQTTADSGNFNISFLPKPEQNQQQNDPALSNISFHPQPQQNQQQQQIDPALFLSALLPLQSQIAQQPQIDAALLLKALYQQSQIAQQIQQYVLIQQLQQLQQQQQPQQQLKQEQQEINYFESPFYSTPASNSSPVVNNNNSNMPTEPPNPTQLLLQQLHQSPQSTMSSPINLISTPPPTQTTQKFVYAQNQNSFWKVYLSPQFSQHLQLLQLPTPKTCFKLQAARKGESYEDHETIDTIYSSHQYDILTKLTDLHLSQFVAATSGNLAGNDPITIFCSLKVVKPNRHEVEVLNSIKKPILKEKVTLTDVEVHEQDVESGVFEGDLYRFQFEGNSHNYGNSKFCMKLEFFLEDDRVNPFMYCVSGGMTVKARKT